MQEGQKLVSTGTSGNARQGTSVALSADGNLVALGGLANDAGIGAVSLFTRTAGQWTQVKDLIGAVVKSASSVALSADGNLVVIGAADDNRGIGATWVFTRKPSGSDEHAGHALCREYPNNILPCSTSVSNAE
jgi:hypothetical protein